MWRVLQALCKAFACMQTVWKRCTQSSIECVAFVNFTSRLCAAASSCSFPDQHVRPTFVLPGTAFSYYGSFPSIARWFCPYDLHLTVLTCMAPIVPPLPPKKTMTRHTRTKGTDTHWIFRVCGFSNCVGSWGSQRLVWLRRWVHAACTRLLYARKQPKAFARTNPNPVQMSHTRTNTRNVPSIIHA